MASTSLALLAFGGLAAETKDGAAAAAGTLSFAGADPSALPQSDLPTTS